MQFILKLLETFEYQLWAAATLLLAVAAFLTFLRSHPFKVRAHLNWARERRQDRRQAWPVFLIAACLLTAALVFRISSGEPMQTRIALVVSLTVVIGVLVFWAVRQAAAQMRKRAADFDFWAAEQDGALRELRSEMDPIQLRRTACDILRRRLGCKRVSMFEPSEAGPFVCTFRTGEDPAPDFELRTFSPLVSELGKGDTCWALPVADASSLRPLPWAPPGHSTGWDVCVQHLRSVETVLALSLMYERKLIGVFLLSARPDGGGFSPNHRRFAEAVASELAECLAAREIMAQEMRRRRAATISEITHRHAGEVLRHLVPSAEPGGPEFDFAISCWPENYSGGIFHHTVSTSGGNHFLFLAEFPNNTAAIDLAVRLVRFQTLLLTPPLTAGQDLGDFVAAKNRALMSAHDYWAAFGFFCARIDIPGKTVRYANCGYCAPIHFSRTESGAEHVRLTAGGPPLCAVPEGRWEMGAVRLEAEDLLVFSSASLAATRNAEGVAWGESRLIESLHPFEDLPCGERVELALRAATRFAGEAESQPARLLAALRLSR